MKDDITSKNLNKNLKFKSNASLILYRYNEKELSIISTKIRESDEKFHLPTTKILKEDNVGTFSIARLMVNDFWGIFNNENIDLILENKEIKINRKEFIKSSDLWKSKEFDEWLDRISNDNVIQIDDLDDEIVYLIEIPYLNLENLNKCLKKLGKNIEFKYFSKNEKFSDFDQHFCDLIESININNLIRSTIECWEKGEYNNYIIISIKDFSEDKRDQVGFFHFPCLFQGLYKQNREKWLIFSAGNLIFPSNEILEKTRAIIIPGSHLNIYNEIPFLNKTSEWISFVMKNYLKIKFLGICFGEQLICTILGGKVDKIFEKKKNNSFFVHGPCKLTIFDEFWEIPFIKSTNVKPKSEYNIFQAHGDEVVELPKFFTNYASSEYCKNEILISNDLRYFLLQGHPEYLEEFNSSRFIMKLNNTIISDNVFRSFCFSFLKNEY